MSRLLSDLDTKVGPVDYSALWPAGSSLLGAVIGAGAVLKSQKIQWKRERVASAENARAGAVEEVLLRALSLDLVSHQMTVIVSEFTSLNGTINRLLRLAKALDFPALFEGLTREAEALNRAAARIWMSADQQTVELANAVVLAATDVVSAHQTVRARGVVKRHVVALIRGREFGDADALKRAREKLANARRALVDHTRRDLGLPPVDLFALPDGFELAD